MGAGISGLGGTRSAGGGDGLWGFPGLELGCAERMITVQEFCTGFCILHSYGGCCG